MYLASWYKIHQNFHENTQFLAICWLISFKLVSLSLGTGSLSFQHISHLISNTKERLGCVCVRARVGYRHSLSERRHTPPLITLSPCTAVTAAQLTCVSWQRRTGPAVPAPDAALMSSSEASARLAQSILAAPAALLAGELLSSSGRTAALPPASGLEAGPGTHSVFLNFWTERVRHQNAALLPWPLQIRAK